MCACLWRLLVGSSCHLPPSHRQLRSRRAALLQYCADRNNLELPLNAFACPMNASCMGTLPVGYPARANQSYGVVTRCAAGNLGPLCGICRPHHYRTLDRCEMCPADGWRMVLQTIVALGVFALLVILYFLLDPWLVPTSLRHQISRGVRGKKALTLSERIYNFAYAPQGDSESRLSKAARWLALVCVFAQKIWGRIFSPENVRTASQRTLRTGADFDVCSTHHASTRHASTRRASNRHASKHQHALPGISPAGQHARCRGVCCHHACCCTLAAGVTSKSDDPVLAHAPQLRILGGIAKITLAQAQCVFVFERFTQVRWPPSLRAYLQIFYDFPLLDLQVRKHDRAGHESAVCFLMRPPHPCAHVASAFVCPLYRCASRTCSPTPEDILQRI